MDSSRDHSFSASTVVVQMNRSEGETRPCFGTSPRYESTLNVPVFLSVGDEDGEAEEGEDAPMKLQPFLAKAERSHLIVWQLQAAES